MVLPDSRLIETRFCMVGYDKIISQRYNDSRIIEYARTPPKKIDATAGFATVSFVRHRPLRRDKLFDLYRRLGNKIIRSKGFILTESGKMELQFSNNVISLRETQQPIQRTELILILHENDKNLIENEFRKIFQEHDNPDTHTNA